MGHPAAAAAVLLAVLGHDARPASDQRRTALAWQERLGESSRLLRAGEPRRALKIVEGVIGQMMERLGPGEAESEAFAMVLVQKALAKAGLGEQDDALWYWHSALGLSPAIKDVELSAFGAPGEFLAGNPLPEDEENGAGEPEGRARVTDDRITPPRPRKKFSPKFPEGARSFGIEGAVLVRVVITKSGIVMSPRIIEALPAPTLTYAALEAVKSARFEPGKLDGEPVDVIYTLTVHYKRSDAGR